MQFFSPSDLIAKSAITLAGRGYTHYQQVKYEIHGDLTDVLNCHCSDCRKAHGAAFRTRASVRVADFKWISGRELVSRYEAKPGEFRTFCSICGSNLVTMFKSKPDV